MTGKGEFGRICDYLAPLAMEGAFDLTDDAAVLSPSAEHELVITTDTIVAGVHFIGDETPDSIAAKLLRVSLSDLAAMGAEPLAYTLNFALPEEISDLWVKEFCRGLAQQQTLFGFGLLGGDSVATPGPVTLSATLFGQAPKGRALRRNGAGPGDFIYVSGAIGDGAFGLMAAKGELQALSETLTEALVRRYRMPEPRLALGRALGGLATAAADVSDGLLADIGHIAEASNVGAIIELPKVPMSEAGKAVVNADPSLWVTAVTGGDDYELVFTGPDVLEKQLKPGSVPIHCIGRVVAGKGVELLDLKGKPLHVDVSGYRHG